MRGDGGGRGSVGERGGSEEVEGVLGEVKE